MPAGLIGKKLGMTSLFTEEGGLKPVTAIEAGPCTVVQVKTNERDGYQAIQVGFGTAKRANKPSMGHAKGLGPFQLLREFRVDDPAKYQVGQKIDVGIFAVGDVVDVVGESRGMGFQGGVKRYHFAGGPKTHGQSDRHRAPGSVGAGTTPGHTYRGQRMAGHMGDARVTTLNLKVARVEPEKGLLFLEGAVPGVKSDLIVIRPGVKVKKRSVKAPVAKDRK